MSFVHLLEIIVLLALGGEIIIMIRIIFYVCYCPASLGTKVTEWLLIASVGLADFALIAKLLPQ